MTEPKLPIVEIIENDGDVMYFVGRREIAKPKRLAEPVGELVAFSDTGLGGKRHVFTEHQVAAVQDMQVSAKPNWL